MRGFIGFLACFFCLFGIIIGFVGLMAATLGFKEVSIIEGVGVSRLALGLGSAIALAVGLMTAIWRSNHWPKEATIESRGAEMTWAFIAFFALGAAAAFSFAAVAVGWVCGSTAAALLFGLARSKGTRLVQARQCRLENAKVRPSQRWVAWFNWALSWAARLRPQPFMPVTVLLIVLFGCGCALALLASQLIPMSLLEAGLAAIMGSLLTLIWWLFLDKRAARWDGVDYRAYSAAKKEELPTIRVGRGIAPGYEDELLEEPDAAPGRRRS